MVSRKTMMKLKKSSRTAQYLRFFSCAVLAMGLWCASIFASVSILVPEQVYAQSEDSIPGGNVSNPTIRAVDIAKPAVVRIWTDVPGHLTVHFPPTTDVSFPQKTNGNYQLSFTGTGTFISSQGDVLTANHVVDPPHDKTLNQALYEEAAQDIADYMNRNGQAGSTQVSAKDVVQQLTSGQLQSTPAYDDPTSRVYLSTDYAGTFTASDLNSVPTNFKATVDKIKAQSPTDQEDVAIVHVPMTDTPGVALGNSEDVQQQDQLTVIGFPGNADVSQKPQAFLASSISSVYVSAKKPNDNGAPLIQVSGNINHGNSGGPALNSQGKIVGVVSFGLSEGNGIEGTSFLQASSSALKLAQSIKLDMTPGSFQKLWRQAFEDYGATTPGHWHKAEREFTQLKQSYPQFQAVQPLLDYAQTQAKSESENPVSATPTNSRPNPAAPSSGLAQWQGWAIGGGVVVLLLVLAVSHFTASMRKRKRESAVGLNATRGKGASSIARPKPSESPAVAGQSPDSKETGQSTLTLTVFPCGHMNRSGARFCNVCGEPGPGK
jgi:S1-C subfamily serine protease